jgi:hypothetical protein
MGKDGFSGAAPPAPRLRRRACTTNLGLLVGYIQSNSIRWLTRGASRKSMRLLLRAEGASNLVYCSTSSLERQFRVTGDHGGCNVPFQVGFGAAQPPQDSFFCALLCGFAAQQRAKISDCAGRRPARSRRCNHHGRVQVTCHPSLVTRHFLFLGNRAKGSDHPGWRDRRTPARDRKQPYSDHRRGRRRYHSDGADWRGWQPSH